MIEGLRKHLAAVIVLPVCVAAGYWHTLDYPFALDDMNNIVENRHIRMETLTYPALQEATKGVINERPVANLSFGLNYFMSGYTPRTFRLTNLAIHLGNGFLVYGLVLCTLRLAGTRRHRAANPGGGRSGIRGLEGAERRWRNIGLATAAIWLLHPVQIQSVTYIVQRMNSFAAFFYLVSLYLYNYTRTRVDGTILQLCLGFSGIVLCWFLALGCKANAATLPLLLAVYEVLFLRQPGKKIPARLWLTLGIVFGGAAFFYLGSDPMAVIEQRYIEYEFDFTPLERLMTQSRVVIFYLALLFAPATKRLNLEHDFATSHSLLEPPATLLAVATLAVILGVGLRRIKTAPLMAFGILWFFVHLLIESTIIGLEMAFEYRLYVASIGPIFLVVGTYFRLAGRGTGVGWNWRALPLVAVAIGLCAITREQNRVWHSAISLWSDCVQKSPHKHRPNNNLGESLAAEGQLSKAEVFYRKALTIEPDYADALYNLGNILQKTGRGDDAVELYVKAVALRPGFAKAHNNLGTLLYNQGKLEEAEVHHRRAIALTPYEAEFHYNLGNDFLRGKDPEGAIPHYDKAIELAADYTVAWSNRGIALFELGRTDAAIAQFEHALSIDPEFMDAHNNLGAAYLRLGQREKAIRKFEEAVRLAPDDPDARAKLEMARQQGR